MPDDASTDEPEPQEGDGPDTDVDTFDAERAMAKIAKANNEAKALRARLRDAEAKAAKLDELEDAKKSDHQKLEERASAAERKAQEAERRALVLEVATEKGLSAAQAKRLVGNTREDLEADADELLETFTPAADADGEEGEDAERPTPPRKPQERLRPGGGDPTKDSQPDPLKDALAKAVGAQG